MRSCVSVSVNVYHVVTNLKKAIFNCKSTSAPLHAYSDHPQEDSAATDLVEPLGKW